MVFLARFAGALTRSVLEGASADPGDRCRVLVEGVSGEGRPSETETSLGERSDMLEDEGDGSISGVASGGWRNGDGR